MANTRYTQLPPVAGLDGFEIVPVDQSDGLGGFVTRRTTTGEIAGAAGSVQPTVPYVVTEPSGFVPSARVLTGTAGQIGVTDGGAGADITLDLLATAVTPGTYGGSNKYTQITVDAFGRITAASEGADAGTGTVTSVGTGTGLTGGSITTTGTVSFAVAAVGTWAATPSSANLAAAMTDETGTGSLMFGTSPTITTSLLAAAGTPPIGTGAAPFGNLFLGGTSKIDFGNGDVTITASTNAVAFAGASSGYSFDALLNISGASAGQIQFPATQNPSSNANTLDDYEEGTTSPTITAEVGTPTTTSTNLRYTKIGRLVVIQGDITSVTVGTASGALIASGLPFSSGIVSGVNGFGGSSGKGVAGYISGTGFNMRNADGTSPWIAGNANYIQCSYSV